MNLEPRKFIKMQIPNKCMELVLLTCSVFVVFATVSGMMDPRTVSAEEIEIINASTIVPAPIDKVWSIVSDVDNDKEYWSVYKEITNVNTSGNVTERDIILNVNDDRAHQIITLHPKNSIILNQTEGPITGTRTMTLTVPNNGDNDTKIDVIWKVDLSKIPIFGKGFAKDGIFKTTEEALSRISEAAK
jgi:hypothetical protein